MIGVEEQARIRSCISVVPDWPKPGVQCQDLSGVMADPTAFRHVIDGLSSAATEGRERIDMVVGIEARGFPYGAALAHHLGAGFVTARKPGKLPGSVHARAYELEYGTATLELHQDAMSSAHCVVIVDDVLATGGTAAACADLVRRTGAHLSAAVFVLHLPGAGGDEALRAAGVEWRALL